MITAVVPLVLAMVLSGAGPAGVIVSGRVAMPDTCSPEVSPAVVRLEPIGASASPQTGGDPAVVHLIDQQGMRFEPRITALQAGETIRFGNSDPDLHNVHVGKDFNRGIAPGTTADFTPNRPGIHRVVCDVHSHMRAYLVVGGSRWVTACGRTGAFRFQDVPPGRYRLEVWHEMGAPQEREMEVNITPVELPEIVVKEGINPTTAADRDLICATGCEPWPLVIDRIAVTLAASLDAAGRPDATERAVPLAQDAFYRDFEASGMDAAIRVHLGQERASRLEGLFHEVTDTTRDVVAGSTGAPAVLAPTRRALLDLAKASSELNSKGVTERSRIFASTSPAFWVESTPNATPLPPTRSWPIIRVLLSTFTFVTFVALFVGVFKEIRRSAPGPSLKTRILIFLCMVLMTIQVGWNGLKESSPPAPPVATAPKAETPLKQAGPPSATGAAPVRERPIGVDVVKNHLRIAASWYPAVRVAGARAPAKDEIDLVAHVHATEGNPNGFAKGEWLPYLSIKYTLTPATGPPVTGTFRPLLAAEGPRYVARITPPGPGKFRLTFRLVPPSIDVVGRLDDPASGVAPWWEPFEAVFDGSLQTGNKP
jgi:periplasmic iron binding protein